MNEVKHTTQNQLKQIVASGRIYIRYFHLFLLFACVLFSAAGCQQYTARRLSPVTLYRQRQQSALNSSGPSLETQQFLRLEFLAAEYETDPMSVIEKLYDRTRRSPDPATIFATAELSLLEARKIYEQNPKTAISMYLKSAALAYDYLFPSKEFDHYKALKPSYRFMELVYNRAVSRFVEIQERNPNRWNDELNFEYLGTRYEITVEKGRGVFWDVNNFDSFTPSNEIEVKGLTNIYFERGAGATLVGFVDKPAEHPLFRDYSSPEGLAQPVTAVLAFEDPVETSGRWSRKAVISFYNPLLTDSASLGGRKVPLEADYSTPLGVLLARIKAKTADPFNLLSTPEYLETAGLYMLEPYRPDQIPVVMIHGLYAYPATWMPMFNDLRGDPAIRSKYQFWFFHYPTGLPVLYSAALLRDDLLEIRDRYDPEGKNPNFNKMVLLGHSLGGLLVKPIVQDSGTTYWDEVFIKPPGQLSLGPENSEFVQNILIFERLPFVRKVIFLGVPHLGTDMADSLAGRIGSSFITFPTQMEKLRKELRAEDMTEDATDLMRRFHDGIMQMSPQSPLIETLASVRMDNSATYHSIIGTEKGKTGPGSSDGVVTYESAHLAEAVSEKFIPAGHSMHTHPLTIAEVKRILLDHLNEQAIAKN